MASAWIQMIDGSRQNMISSLSGFRTRAYANLRRLIANAVCIAVCLTPITEVWELLENRARQDSGGRRGLVTYRHRLCKCFRARATM